MYRLLLFSNLLNLICYILIFIFLVGCQDFYTDKRHLYIIQDLVELQEQRVFLAFQEIQVDLDWMDVLGHLDPQVTQALYNLHAVGTLLSV